jgi:hypothetical protein
VLDEGRDGLCLGFDVTDLNRSFPDGTLLRAEGRPKVWLFHADIRWGIPSPKIRREVATDGEILDLPVAELALVPTAPPDGTVVAGSESGRYYLIIRGIRFWLSSEQLFDLGLPLAPAIVIHDALMGAIPCEGVYRWLLRSKRLRRIIALLLRFAHEHSADARGVLIGILASGLFFVIAKLVG